MKRVFQPPTIDQLRAYAGEIGYKGFDAQAWLDYYESVGWTIGRTRKPMVSWRAAVRTWWRNQAEWNNRAKPETDPAVLDYARQGAAIIRAGGYEIGRFWAKVRDAIGEEGCKRVQTLARAGAKANAAGQPPAAQE